MQGAQTEIKEIEINRLNQQQNKAHLKLKLIFLYTFLENGANLTIKA